MMRHILIFKILYLIVWGVKYRDSLSIDILFIKKQNKSLKQKNMITNLIIKNMYSDSLLSGLQ